MWISHKAPAEAFWDRLPVSPHVFIRKQWGEEMEGIQKCWNGGNIELGIVASPYYRHWQFFAIGKSVYGEKRETEVGEPWS